MFQKIVESETFQNLHIHTLENASLISASEVELLDVETQNNLESVISELLRTLPDSITLRIYLKAQFDNETSDVHSRYQAIKQVGFIQMKAFLVFELSPPMPLNFKKLKHNPNFLIEHSRLEAFTQFGLEARSLTKSEIESILPELKKEIHHQFQTIDTGSDLLSILRLTKQSEFGVAPAMLCSLKDSLPLPYTISVSLKPISQSMSETMLRRRSKQSATSQDLKESRKYSEAQTDLEDISLNGTKLFNMEWQVLLQRSNEDWLRADREDTKRKLSPLGEIYIESVGALNSLKAIYPGGGLHHSLIEKDEVVSCYLPLRTRGESGFNLKLNAPSRVLALHRRDDSLTYVDILDPNYESFSWCIFGRPGTGKSVLVNSITRALAHDPNIKIIKIDVGGSHSRETELLGGLEKTLSLNEPTGINPLEILEDLGPSKEAIQILTSFLEVLILEEGETKLSKTLKSDLEKIIHSFSETTLDKNLESFYQFSPDIPRRNLLARWVGSGVYGNAFKKSLGAEGDGLDITRNNLVYFNFSKISQAQDPDYAQGGLAAVMAKFNYEMLKKNEHKKRIIFIADETPFFIQKCFNFFNLSIANIRKEGHGFITVAQKSSHVVINGDTAILDNSPNKIFFSQDGDVELFKARTQLSDLTVSKIQGLERKVGEFSEAYLKDQKGERVIKIRLSPEEYWSYTSKDEDKRKFQELRKACPSLGLKEVIKCLSL